jgi:hypothetical protein
VTIGQRLPGVLFGTRRVAIIEAWLQGAPTDGRKKAALIRKTFS